MDDKYHPTSHGISQTVKIEMILNEFLGLGQSKLSDNVNEEKTTHSYCFLVMAIIPKELKSYPFISNVRHRYD